MLMMLAVWGLCVQSSATDAHDAGGLGVFASKVHPADAHGAPSRCS